MESENQRKEEKNGLGKNRKRNKSWIRKKKVDRNSEERTLRKEQEDEIIES